MFSGRPRESNLRWRAVARGARMVALPVAPAQVPPALFNILL